MRGADSPSPDPVLTAHLAASRPTVVSALMRRFRDLARAEDGFQAAALRALEVWPTRGTPRDPEAWLVRVGHNALIDGLRKDRRFTGLEARDETEDALLQTLPIEEEIDRAAVNDDVLRLLFLCCHPALSETDQLTLSLRHVLGLEIADIAKAFLITPDTAQRRLSRARIRAEKLGSPDKGGLGPKDRKARIEQVRGVLYLMFNRGYAAARGEAHIQPVFCQEATRMTRLLLRLFPDEPETMGLLSLMLGLAARFPARLDAAGALVSLDRQDRTLWNRSAIGEARHLVQKALRKGESGPYQIQAAICDVHNAARRTEDTEWRDILFLYDALLALQPTATIHLNRLVALAEVKGTDKALEGLRGLAAPLADYLPYHAVHAGLSERAGRTDEAARAYRRALTCHPSREEHAHILRQLAQLEENTPSRENTTGLSE